MTDTYSTLRVSTVSGVARVTIDNPLSTSSPYR